MGTPIMIIPHSPGPYQVALSRHENRQPTHIGWKASSDYGVLSSVTVLLESSEIPCAGFSSSHYASLRSQCGMIIDMHSKNDPRSINLTNINALGPIRRLTSYTYILYFTN